MNDHQTSIQNREVLEFDLGVRVYPPTTTAATGECGGTSSDATETRPPAPGTSAMTGS